VYAASAWADDEALKTGIDAYVYAYPLVLMDVTRLYVEKTTGAKDNMFLQGPASLESGSTRVSDNLVSAAWLDLSGEPVVLHLPAGRSVELMDAWTNIFATPSATEARDFVIVGPSWYGDTPSGLTVIASPTEMAFIPPPSSGAAESVLSSQDRMSLTPLSSYGKPDDAAIPQRLPLLAPMKLPSEQVADMDAKTFFSHFMRLLMSNPPASADADIVTDLVSWGLVPGPGFDFNDLDPGVKDMLSLSVEPAQMKIRSSMAHATEEDLTTYLSRARKALATFAVNIPAGPVCRDEEVLVDSAKTADESEENLSLENGILFKAEGRKGTKVGFDIKEDIARGQEFLRDKIAGCSRVNVEKRVTFYKKGRKKEKLVARTIVRPNFLLAVEDLDERKIRQVLITSRGCVTKGFRVTRIRANGVASRFEITYPENMAILALRTTVRSGNGLKEVVYTPYSPEIDTKEVRKAGLDYLMGRIQIAEEDLATKKVRLAEFGRGDGIPEEISLVLSIIEHIDPVRFEHYKGNEIALIHEVLTIIGANTTEAYRYSKSPAGAMGLFQFIPKTYRMLLERYRSAGLVRDFTAGCTDHANAAKASLLLFNSDLASLPARLWSAARKDGRSLGMFVAAAYNCGPKRVEKSARACRGQWTCRLPQETRVYLEKFDAVWNVRNALDR
ncbi:MAG TPA: DUF1254 domain-containing protein, partial [Syntrophorhabdales bacterium]|nr:DUF1254 domain-containing protein [Syntrophorhabdales bacterium]